MIENKSLNILTTYYPSLTEEIEQTLIDAKANKKPWFDAHPFRKSFVDNIFFYNSTALLVNALWQRCAYTAPLALSIIAPHEAYLDYEQDFLRLGLVTNSQMLKNLENVKHCFENFIALLQAPLNDNEAQAILCNFNCGSHVFLIEKRKETCLLFQSFFKKGDQSYNFAQYLNNKSKKTSWSIAQFLKELEIVINPQESMEQRNSSFKNLFFCLPSCNLKERGPLLVFIESAIYRSQA